jgi:hypothetical protein
MGHINKNQHPQILRAASRIWQRIRQALSGSSVCHTYRPERHYMRGPGPKYRAKGCVPMKHPGLR